MAMSRPEQTIGVPPVFIPCRNLPDNSNRDAPYTCRELCAASERISGYNSIVGAQRIGGLWRVYPASNDARMKLLLKGIQIRKHTVNPFDKNPYIIKTPNGEREIPTTKLIIGNLPISYSNSEIEGRLLQLGCQPQSKMLMERDRDDKGGLTRWLTGRRYMYIKVPDRPLPEKVTIGPATATLYHREQKLSAENATCSRCLEKGHRALTCSKDVVCRSCKKIGHRAGDPDCSLNIEAERSNNGDSVETQQSLQGSGQAPDVPSSTVKVTPQKAPDARHNTVPQDSPLAPPATPPISTQRRGRTSQTQSRLNFQSRSLSRTREKRPRNSPPQQPDANKTARLDTDQQREQVDIQVHTDENT